MVTSASHSSGPTLFVEAVTASMNTDTRMELVQDWRLGHGEPTGREDSRVITSVGPPGPGTMVVIRSAATGCQLPELTVGEICVQGASKSRGYWQDPIKSREALEAEVLSSDTGKPLQGTFLRSGDLGFLYQGEVFICGRVKDVIIIRGKNYYPQVH